MSLTFKDATKEQIDAWVDMRVALWKQYSRDELRKEALSLLDNPKYQTIFVEFEADLAGFIEIRLRDVAEGCDSSPVAYIEGWYVKPEYQQQGIGMELQKHAEAWAKSQGCSEMASDTEEDNDKSVAAHTKAGFRVSAHLIHFYKKI